MTTPQTCRRVCAWCGAFLGTKLGEGTTHGICPSCAEGVMREVVEAGGVVGESTEPAVTLAQEKRAAACAIAILVIAAVWWIFC